MGSRIEGMKEICVGVRSEKSILPSRRRLNHGFLLAGATENTKRMFDRRVQEKEQVSSAGSRVASWA